MRMVVRGSWRNLLLLFPTSFFVQDTYEDIISGEQDLERDIAEGIETKRQKLKLLALELRAEYDDAKFARKLSLLEEEDQLKKELHRLESEKSRRLEDYKNLSVVAEAALRQARLEANQFDARAKRVRDDQLAQ